MLTTLYKEKLHVKLFFFFSFKFKGRAKYNWDSINGFSTFSWFVTLAFFFLILTYFVCRLCHMPRSQHKKKEIKDNNDNNGIHLRAFHYVGLIEVIRFSSFHRKMSDFKFSILLDEEYRTNEKKLHQNENSSRAFFLTKKKKISIKGEETDKSESKEKEKQIPLESRFVVWLIWWFRSLNLFHSLQVLCKIRTCLEKLVNIFFFSLSVHSVYCFSFSFSFIGLFLSTKKNTQNKQIFIYFEFTFVFSRKKCFHKEINFPLFSSSSFISFLFQF